MAIYLFLASNEINHGDSDNQRRTRRHNQQSTHETITRIENPYYGQEEDAGKMHCSKHHQCIYAIFTKYHSTQ